MAAGGRETVAQMLAYLARESGMLFGVFGLLEFDPQPDKIFVDLMIIMTMTSSFVALGVMLERLRGEEA